MNKVIVCQHGNRHRYAIAEILHREGMAVGLYTDSCEYSFLGKLAKMLSFLPVAAIRNLARRRVRLPEQLVKTTDRTLFCPRRGNYTATHAVLSRAMIRWGTDNADVVYSMYDEALDFLKFAKAHQCRIVVDVFISPLADYLEYVAANHTAADVKNFINDELSACLDLADLITCPSVFVADGIRELYPQHLHKIRICPYGTSVDFGGEFNRPQPGRFFWAGNCPFRKGLHLFAEAAANIKSNYPQAEFRVAGITDPEITRDPRYRALTFLGKLDAPAMKREFLYADAFVLPSLAEGMASVCVEALSAGCPLIVPPSAGIDPVDGNFPGILLTELTASALTGAMTVMLNDRSLRNDLAQHASRQSAQYTKQAWAKRLYNIFNEAKHCGI